MSSTTRMRRRRAGRRCAAGRRAAAAAARPRLLPARAAAARRTRCPCPARRCAPRPCRRASRRGPSPASGRCPARPAIVAPWSTCTNTSKTRGQHLGGDARSPVSRSRSTARARPPARRVSRIVPLARRVLGGVGQQVADDLRQPHRVGVEADRFLRERDGRARGPCASTSGRTVSTARATTVASSTCSLRRSSDLAPHDAGHVEQVVDQPDEVADLPLDHRPRDPSTVAGSTPAASAFAARCGSGRAGCAARGPASPGTRPCGGRLPAARERAARAGRRPRRSRRRCRAARSPPRRTGRGCGSRRPASRSAAPRRAAGG